MRAFHTTGLALVALLGAATSGTAQESTSPPVDSLLRVTPARARDTVERVATLAPVRVTAHTKRVRHDHTGFDEREKLRGFGRFLTAAKIESMRVPSVMMLFSMIPGLQVERSTNGSRIFSRGYVDLSRRCEPAVYLDGSIVHSGASVIETVVRPNEVRGIEVYLQLGTAPPPYDRDPCGSVLVWTKLPELDDGADTGTP